MNIAPSPDHSDAFTTVTARYGTFMINRHDVFVGASLIRYGEYVEHEWQLMRRFINAGDCVIDAGANIGAFSVPMAQAVGTGGSVHAFEPQPALFNCLKHNAQHNNLPQIIIHLQGLGEHAHTIQTAIPDYDIKNNLGAFSFETIGDDLKIDVIALDSLKFSKLSFIKMDIEGMELKALKGAAGTLARDRPVLYVENDKLQGASALIQWLEQQRYRLWWHTARLFNPTNFNAVSENIFPGFRTVNMLCIPIERLDLLPLVPSQLKPVVDGQQTQLMLDGTIDSYCF